MLKASWLKPPLPGTGPREIFQRAIRYLRCVFGGLEAQLEKRRSDSTNPGGRFFASPDRASSHWWRTTRERPLGTRRSFPGAAPRHPEGSAEALPAWSTADRRFRPGTVCRHAHCEYGPREIAPRR